MITVTEEVFKKKKETALICLFILTVREVAKHYIFDLQIRWAEMFGLWCAIYRTLDLILQTYKLYSNDCGKSTTQVAAARVCTRGENTVYLYCKTLLASIRVS